MGRRATTTSTEKPTIQVSKAAKDRFVRWLSTHRNPHQGETVGAIIEWFLEQPATVQHVILKMVPPELNDAYAERLELIARDLRGDHPRGAVLLQSAKK